MASITMGLAEALAGHVDERTRVKGNRYFLGGAVRAIEGSASHVTATVRGSEWYQVHLTRTGDEILASCGCPYFADRNDVCKHIWAVVLAADAEGFLIGDEPLTRDVYLESAYSGGWNADANERVPARRARPAAPRARWQRFLESVRQRIAQADPADAGRGARGEILYAIDACANETLAVTLQVQWRARKKSGGWGRPQPAALLPAEIESLPDARDRDVLSLLFGATPVVSPYSTSVSSRASFELAGPIVERVVPLLAQSGRLYVREEQVPDSRRYPRPATRDEGEDADLPFLAWDQSSPWEFRLDVALDADDHAVVDGAFHREGGRVPAAGPRLLLSGGLFVLAGAVARFDAGRLLPWLLELRRSGPARVPLEAAQSLAEALARSDVDPSPLPEPLRYEIVAAAPAPRIRLARSARPQGHGTRDELSASVEFDYAGSVVTAGSDVCYDSERRRLVRRDRAAEDAALRRLRQLGFHRAWYAGPRAASLAIGVERFPAAVRALVEESWRVEAEGRLIRAARALQVHVSSGVDWFELRGQVDFGEGRTASVAGLLAALRRGEATVLLDDGTRGMVPEEWLRRYARAAGFGEAHGDHVRYRRSQAALLDALLESQPAGRVDEPFARARAELARFSGVHPVDPPPTFRGHLRQYQREALGWFEFLRRFGFGGCLADDMGLGKTVMVLALLESRRTAADREAPRPSIAVVPRSLMFNWMDEAARFAPGLRVLDYSGGARASLAPGECDLLLTTYGTLRRDAARLAELEFDYAILDEAQTIKNAATASAKAARVLRARHRLALSGTPVENHLGEIWSLFEFLNPGFLGPTAALARPPAGAQRIDRTEAALMARALRPFILRRTKAQVAPELPDKVEQTIQCELEGTQRRLYDELRAHYRDMLRTAVARKGLNRSKLQVLEALLRLRQAATHPGLVDPGRVAEPSAKFELLLSRLREIVDEGHKALVFSQFTSLLALLRPRLEEEGIVYEYLDGRTRDRAQRVSRFEHDNDCRVFLLSLKAGGVGLNLTSAGYVFLLDPWWNPAVEAQAVDRTHRIGQSKHVFAYRLIARDTVEEKIAELQASKRELAEAIFAGNADLLRTLTPEDLDWLLS